MTGSIRDNRVLFDKKCIEIFSGLTQENKEALATALNEFVVYAIGQAEVSIKKNKHMMYAYWRVLAVYAKHMVKFIRKARTAETIKYTNATKCKMYPNYIDYYRYFGSNLIFLERKAAGEVIYKHTIVFEGDAVAAAYFEENCGA